MLPSYLSADGFTPTMGGMVVNLQPEDQILISVMVDHDANPLTPDREYFITNYTRYTGDDYFTYDPANKTYTNGHFMRLMQQASDATEPSEMTVWTVDTALTRVDTKNAAQGGANKDYALGGISYTIWNDGRTLKTNGNDRWRFYGDLESDINNDKLCDVVFVIPMNRTGIASFDPSNTMGRGTNFNGATGTGFLGMTYREVYMLEIPRFNVPVAYTNAALVTFNTSRDPVTWGGIGKSVAAGCAGYAYADSKHNPTKRTIFRLYILNKPFVTCPNSYFFAYSEQSVMRYRQGPTTKAPIYSWTDSTTAAKIYTQDYLFPMKRVGDTKYYQTNPMNVPVADSSYFYVGWHDDYRNGRGGDPSEPLGSSTAGSQFTKIRTLPLKNLPGFMAPAGAYGRMIVDTTSAAQNLDVKFEPARYFFRTSTGMNVELKQIDDSTWMAEKAWHIIDDYMELQGTILLSTDSVFSLADKGAAISGWSVMVDAPLIPVYGKPKGTTVAGKTGWPRIHTNRTAANGGIEFVEAVDTAYILYDNNGHFGSAIPDQHPIMGKSKVAVQNHRLIQGYEFICWTNVADTTSGSCTKYHPGDSVDLSTVPVVNGKRILHLYAQAKYTGYINVAISFVKEDGKRYFMTHPGNNAPRYARARHFNDWTDVRQGMGDGYNSDPNYLSSYTLLGHEGVCKECEIGEYVLDPRRDTMRAADDQFIFYEDFAPQTEEFLGLYYLADPNTVIANNTWAGLFQSTKGWPTPAKPCIDSTRLFSTHYLDGYPSAITRKERLVNPADASSGTLPFNVKYNATDNQFDGAAAGDSTSFMISGIGVVDAHYVIIPDTTVVWRDTIDFVNITTPHPRETVTSKLIGKHLLAQMTVGDEIIYLHPNRTETYTTANELHLTPEYRLTQNFTFIPDSRVTSLEEDDRPRMENVEGFGCEVVGGHENPMNVRYNGEYIDIVDTLRVSLTQGDISKIKEYYGRWKDDAVDSILPGGNTRYRDVIVRTKTLHYGAPIVRLTLTPEKEKYTFNPLATDSKQINFTLAKEISRPLLDVDGNEVSVEVIASETITTSLALGPGACSFASGGSIFTISEAVSQHVTLSPKANNKEGDNLDTLIISTTVKIDGVDCPVTARVPLLQVSLEGDELIWSVVSGKQRYYIMAGTGGLIFRKYKESGSVLYKEGSSTQLVKGSANAANDDAKYITPWHFSHNPENANQIALKTEAPVNRYLKMLGEVVDSRAGLHESDSSFFTYHYVNVYTNDNANEEEQVKLQYGSDKWLQFTLLDGGGAELKLVASEEDASVFSWSYLNQEYSLLNKGTYPSQDSVTFGYNANTSVGIQTRYKARKEYSMLVGNKVVYLCREDEEVIANLTDEEKEWLTSYTITRIPDHRTFDKENPEGPNIVSGLSSTLATPTLVTTVSTSGSPTSPTNITIDGKYVNIVDTLQVTLSTTREDYRFSYWNGVSSISDACLKIPLIRKTYHDADYDSIVCVEKNEEYNHIFPNTITTPVKYKFQLVTKKRTGKHVLDVNNVAVAVKSATETDLTALMDLGNKAYAEVQLIDAFGNTPTWCQITDKDKDSIVVTCTQSGIRTPRVAYIYIAFVVVEGGKMRFVNYRLTVSQPSLFDYENNQRLVHSPGASGDPIDGVTGMQQVHENKRILYYYPDQNVELPVRESHFFGWWRWFREGGEGIGDTDIPEEDWRDKPVNASGSYSFPFRIIGNEVDDGKGGKKLVTMGRYTVFHYRSSQYPNVRNNPPIQTVRVAPPITTYGIADASKPTVTYAVDISNYYDKLPMSVKYKNQVDTARLDTMTEIPEPTLSIREVFELRPWTEMADTLEHYKSTRTTNDEGEYPLASEHYMEDHVVMAPLYNQLLLSTEQRYNLENLATKGHSESLLGYYMRDDNWSGWSANKVRQDTMIWCGGWDADCEWYTYNPKTQKYTKSTLNITASDDYLIVPAKNTVDTIYYCLRARSWASTFSDATDDATVTSDSGAYMFNICRYMVIYHDRDQYGPKLETKGKAIMTNDEIEQRYEVLERLDFDYNQPGSNYTVYPHPLPWADASYGYTYPETPDLPHNRLHTQSALPNFGEYGLINRIGYTDYWYDMEQHGGASNGYMIYCDGMSSAGQVAALSLRTHLCAGQKMFFSAYVGNPSNQKGKSKPNFTINVQGSTTGSVWENITSYMTGDIDPSDSWYQIYFPIIFNEAKDYEYFRVRIYNMASSWDGNDFTLDDMCLFATKPPLIAYQANTACKEKEDVETPTHVILRVDYQGITGEGYNNQNVYYTVKRVDTEGEPSFVEMIDHYLAEDKSHTGKIVDAVKVEPDTIFGKLYIPGRTYTPSDKDSIFVNMNELIDTFDVSNGVFKEGYIYEILEGDIRPVKYIIHHAYLNPADTFTVHMSAEYSDLLSSICGMTSYLKVSNRMVLELNGEEIPDMTKTGLCANATYDIGLRVKGSLYLDSVAPISLNGTCYNDWLLYGDTAEATSEARYGYKYEDIVKVVKDILRCEPLGTRNANQFAPTLAAVSRNEMKRIQESQLVRLSDPELHPYDILAHLVNNGFLTLYQQHLTATVYWGDSIQCVIFPILGTGSDAMHSSRVEVCPLPLLIKLKPDPEGAKAPLIIGGIHRDPSELNQPIVVLADAVDANQEIVLHVDSIMPGVGIRSVELLSTDDPGFNEGIHSLTFTPNMDYPAEEYYTKGSDILLHPSTNNNYYLQPGYTYTFGLVMETILGKDTLDGGCPVGTVPFALSVVPNYLRWDPQDETSDQWNRPGNWIGINAKNEPIQVNARFAPLATTKVVIPPLAAGLPYPTLPDLDAPATYDSIQEIGFIYNTCADIRFLPGAAMSDQERLTFDNAIIDMSIPQQKWALRSAPVTGMISGDLYMSNADLIYESNPWKVGSFDANGRNHNTGNASFWLSLYNTTTVTINAQTANDTTRSEKAEWSKVTNGLTLPLSPAQGWAVYARTKSGNAADVRLPKDDDIYYYYGSYGEQLYDLYEDNLRALRAENAGESSVGQLAFYPGAKVASQSYTLTNTVASKSFVFGNPSMGYIDIWGFIADNAAILKEEIDYLDDGGYHSAVVRATAEYDVESDVITNRERYLPPMHAMMVKFKDDVAASTTLTLTLNANRIVTSPSQKAVRPVAPRRIDQRPKTNDQRQKGIMTVTAINPVSNRCVSRLLLGQGYDKAIVSGEDAVLTTFNIDKFHMTNTPTTPFNIYAMEGAYGLSIDLLDSIVNIPVSFYMSNLPYAPVTQLWFTGVNSIDGPLVFYDALLGTERPIIDGICMTIETPETSHEKRYYIRRPGYTPEESTNPGTTTEIGYQAAEGEQAVKILYHGNVYILRGGHVYTMIGQQVR